MFEEGSRLREQFGADNVFDFSLGNPHLEPPARLVERLRELTASPIPGMHRYMPNPGFPHVRAKVADWVGRQEGMTVPATHIVMVCGAASGLNIVFRALLDPGDEVIVFAPIFPEYQFYVMHAGGQCRLVETTADFDLDLDCLEEAITENTRAVLLNSPNNPTGRVYSRATVGRLAELLQNQNRRRARPILLVSDEPYRRLVYDGATVPGLFELYPHTITVASFSKDLGLAGERIGYLAVHPQFENADEVLAGLIFCLRTLGFVNAPALIQLAIADVLDASVDVAAYQFNRDLLLGGLRDIGYEVVRPEGAFYLFPRSPIPDDTAFVARLQSERILAVPGQGFARPGHFRLSYALDPDVIRRSLPGFQRAFHEVTGERGEGT
jgi:aspartate aminotransferase